MAASSAFPGAFAPIAFKYESSGGSEQSTVNLLLADGGLTDNSGVSLVVAAWKYHAIRTGGSEHLFDVVISFNGGKRLQLKDDGEEVSAPFRALDVVYAASGVYISEDEAKRDGPRIIALAPEHALPESSAAVRSLVKWAAHDDQGVLPIRQKGPQSVLRRGLSEEKLSTIVAILDSSCRRNMSWRAGGMWRKGPK